MADLIADLGKILILALAGGLVAALATAAAMGVSLLPYFRSRSDDWRIQAQLAWPGRVAGRVCYLLLPAVLAVVCTAREGLGSPASRLLSPPA
jgi:hypothetical protein